MDLSHYLRIARRRSRVILAAVLLTVAAAGVATVLTPPRYQSSVEFFVSVSNTATNGQLASGGSFTQQRVKSYAQLVKTPRALDQVADQTGAGSGADLAQAITATVPPDSVLIDVAVVDADPAVAQQIASTIAQTFPQTVTQIEQVDGPSPVKVTVVKNAALPTDPVSPQPVKNLLLALVLGGLLGVALAVVRDRLDVTVRSTADLSGLSTAPNLGGIPYDPNAPRQALALLTDPMGRRAEAYRALRTNLRFVNAARRPRRIVVTSAIVGEGKSTTTANLAMALADSGASVCAIEADLRRPGLLSSFGLDGGIGLTDVLIGNCAIDEVLQPFGDLPLDLLGAGTLPPNPSELLGSPVMVDLLDQLTQRYDVVLCDAPPVLPVTDAAVLATHCDGVLVIAASGAVTVPGVTETLRQLDAVGAKVLGIVLNRAADERRDGRYGYGYGYAAYTTERRDGAHRSRPASLGALTASD